MDHSVSLPDLAAAVDLGSNSFHMVVARMRAGSPEIVERRREPVRLAAGLDARKRLSPAARERALSCLARFGQQVESCPAGSVRAVGTNTFRSAHGAGAFLRACGEALGHPVEVISGIEEARLVYVGVSHSLSNSGLRRVVVDIGGGSTEIIVGEGFEPLAMESLYMGCVSMSLGAFPRGALTSAGFRQAELAAHIELEPLAARFRDLGWAEAVGSSGTVRAVDEVLRAAGWGGEGITLSGLGRLRDALIKAGDVSRLKLQGLSAERAPVFAGGVAILRAVLEALGIERMQAAEGALREGLLFDMMGRFRHEDARGRSVAALAARYHVDAGQAARVAATALAALEQVAESWSLVGEEPAWLLRWGAELAEIGLDIAHSHYHWHGAYVIENADLFGFSRDEQRLVATLVRAHRRKFPVGCFDALGSEWKRPAERLAVLLRIAVAIHRSRSQRPVPGFRLTARKRTLRLTFPEGWLAGQTLTRADLEQEAADLKAARFRLLLD